VKKLRAKLVEASAGALDHGERLGVRAAGEDTQRVLRSVEETLKGGAPNAMAAAVVLKKIEGDLSSANANLDRVIESAKQRAAAKKGAPAPTPTAGGAGAGTKVAPAATAKWKCAYCGKEHDDSVKKCDNCGAAR
jgi:hypothetical protein